MAGALADTTSHSWKNACYNRVVPGGGILAESTGLAKRLALAAIAHRVDLSSLDVWWLGQRIRRISLESGWTTDTR